MTKFICPECKSKGKMCVLAGNKLRFFIVCTNRRCDYETDEYYTEKEAIENWKGEVYEV